MKESIPKVIAETVSALRARAVIEAREAVADSARDANEDLVASAERKLRLAEALERLPKAEGAKS